MIRIELRAARALAPALFATLAAFPAAAEVPRSIAAALEAARREAGAIRIELVQMSPDAAVQLNRRIDELERLIQRLTDKIDSLDAQQRELARDYERFKNDTDYRLNQSTRAPARPPERAAQTPAPPPDRRADAIPERRVVPPPRVDEDEPQPRVARRPEPPVRADDTPPAPGGSARDQYEAALGLLRRADYKGAEAALIAFVRRHPNDPLAANAYYWLGENYFAQGRYQDAALQFADGYRKFPTHPKAQDSLFKLGLTLARQNKIGEACATLSEYRKRYPTAGLRREAEAEQRRLHCPG